MNDETKTTIKIDARTNRLRKASDLLLGHAHLEGELGLLVKKLQEDLADTIQALQEERRDATVKLNEMLAESTGWQQRAEVAEARLRELGALPPEPGK
jgi:hypothetical protein